MAKNKPETTEFLPEWDDGTYQTGAIKEPRGSSGLVAFLLLVVIFLGGVCSVLGILNIRLLAQLAEKPGETVPMASDTHMAQVDSDSILDQLGEPVPEVPQNGAVKLHIVDSPYYSPDASGPDGQLIYAQKQRSLVEVQCLTHFNSTEIGIGLVLSADGYILTNSHVVDAAKRIFVTLSDGTMLRAALVGRDNFSDLAVLYIDRQDLVPASFSSNRNLQVSEPTLAFEVGREPLTIRSSNIYSTNRLFSTRSGSIRLIQTCSGGTTGPVFDSFGNVIGFQVSIIADYFTSADTVGVGLVVPTDRIQQIIQQLLDKGYMDGQPSLGMEVEAITKLYQQYWQLPSGLLLTGVEENSNAAAQGLEEGDILVALDSVPVQTRSDLYAILYNHSIGDEVIAVVCRDEQQFTVTLTIEDNADSET